MIDVSVIICTHNPREDYLRRVLEALRNQTLSLASWELLVIDNGSSIPVVATHDISWHPRGRHIREETLGLTTARLRGIHESAADIIVFVDDDTILAPLYLEKAIEISREWPFVGTWGGSISPEFEKPLPSWVGSEVWRLSVSPIEKDVWSNLQELTTMPGGAGLCLRRQVANHYVEHCSHKQNLLLGRKGSALSGYEDIDINHCALDLGLGTGRSPRLGLTHLVPAKRLTLDYFLRHAEGDAASLMLFRAMRGLPIEKVSSLSWSTRLKWLVHRIKNKAPAEQIAIFKAHQRGLQRGYAEAQKFLKS